MRLSCVRACMRAWLRKFNPPRWLLLRDYRADVRVRSVCSEKALKVQRTRKEKKGGGREGNKRGKKRKKEKKLRCNIKKRT